MSSAILQHFPCCSSSFMIFVSSSSSSSDWPRRPWPLLRRNLMPPKGVATPSHLLSSGSMWFWKKPWWRSNTMMTFQRPRATKMSLVVVFVEGMFLRWSLTGLKLTTNLTSSVVSRWLALPLALGLRRRKLGQTYWMLIPKSCGMPRTCCCVSSSHTC